MGTRGAFGVIINEQEKIGYNQYDSYPDGKGVEILRALREAVDKLELGTWRRLASEARVVDNDRDKPTKADIKKLKPWTDLGVSERSTSDWYCLTRAAHGDIFEMLRSGYIYDSHEFPLDSVFCEWAYLIDFDQGVFEVYEGFVKGRPKKGRWAGRPTPEEDLANFKEHLYWCHKNGRDPWLKETSEYGAVELVGSFPFDSLPSDEEFLAWAETLNEEEVPA